MSQKNRGILGALDRHRPAETALVESDEVDSLGGSATWHWHSEAQHPKNPDGASTQNSPSPHVVR